MGRDLPGQSHAAIVVGGSLMPSQRRKLSVSQ